MQARKDTDDQPRESQGEPQDGAAGAAALLRNCRRSRAIALHTTGSTAHKRHHVRAYPVVLPTTLHLEGAAALLRISISFWVWYPLVQTTAKQYQTNTFKHTFKTS